MRIRLALFFILLLSSSFGLAQLLQPTPRTTSNSENSRTAGEIPSEKLKSIWSGDGRGADGTFLALDSYETGSGLRVAITRAKFNAPSAAQKELNRWLKQATRIMERGIRKGSSGQQDYLRALGIFPSATRAGEEYYAVVCTDSSDFYWVSSRSLKWALGVEKELNAHTFHERLESPK